MGEDTSKRSASGAVLSEGTWLDDRFEACPREVCGGGQGRWFEPGAVLLGAGCATAGDYVELRAALDLIVGLTACSTEQTNNDSFKPIDVEVHH